MWPQSRLDFKKEAVAAAMRTAAESFRPPLLEAPSFRALDVKLDATVALAAVFGLVAVNRPVRAETSAGQALRVNTMGHEPTDYGGRAFGAQLAVHRGGAVIVGVPFDMQQRDFRVLRQDRQDRLQDLLAARVVRELGATRLELD